jgi:peroxiredoxin 2/4
MKKTYLITVLLLLVMVQVRTQSRSTTAASKTPGIPLIGVEAPEFTARSTNGEINFPSDFGTNWKILFAHPKNFTPVCSSELLELAVEQENFDRLGAKLVVLSTDDLIQHNSWKAALEEINYRDRGPLKIKFPLVEDNSFRAANLYGMIHSAVSIGENVRGVFIIDPQNKVRAIFYYPNEVGRNIDEIKRTLTALQATHNNKKIVTPANWRFGDDFMVPVITSAERAGLEKPESGIYQLSWFMTYMKFKQ